MSDLGLAMSTASTEAASAVLSNAPMFPGFSGASATRIKGALFCRLMESKVCDLLWAMAKMPSVVSRWANLRYT